MEEYLEFLDKTALFEGLQREEVLRLLSCFTAKLKTFEKGKTVFFAGRGSKWFGVILSGQIQLVTDDRFGNRSIISKIGAGNTFAESFSYADAETLSVSAIAAAESTVLLMDSVRIINPCSHICESHIKLLQNMLYILSKNNALLIEKISYTSKSTTREKLIAFLSNEQKKAGRKKFSIAFNRQELADYLSVDRSAMSTELSRLKRDGILDFYKNEFEFL